LGACQEKFEVAPSARPDVFRFDSYLATFARIHLPPGFIPSLFIEQSSMSSNKKLVKIIGRKRRELYSAEEQTSRLVKTERQVKREMAQTVVSWIEERREQAKELERSSRALISLGHNATCSGD
jgi:hypothetical protein